MTSKSPRLRFAPSPTGRLHVGNMRTALQNALFCLKSKGDFILRIDDTDKERSKPVFEEGIHEDLSWMGLEPAEIFHQSHRFDLYDKASERLKEAGLLYPCYETAEELERKRRLARAEGRPPVYDRTALKLSDTDRSKLEAEGRKPHWRFKLSGQKIFWHDLVRGEQSIETASVSDPVVIRADGSYLYTLPSVVDDIDLGITHIVRGEDHVTNSGVQIEIFEALGGHTPLFAHTPLITDAKGEPLSKRLDSFSIELLREEDYEPMALASCLAKIGTSDPVEACFDSEQLARGFSFEKIGRAPARFDPRELSRLNAHILRETPYTDLKLRLDELGVSEALWEAVKANISVLEDALLWKNILEHPLDPVLDNPGLTQKAAELLPLSPLTPETWSLWTKTIQNETGVKGKKLFLPLRLALTGQSHGPDMAQLLPLIGYDKTLRRLQGKTA